MASVQRTPTVSTKLLFVLLVSLGSTQVLWAEPFHDPTEHSLDSYLGTPTLKKSEAMAQTVRDPTERSLDRILDAPIEEKEGGNNFHDYYDRNPRVRNLLHTVEAYHMEQGIGKLKRRRYESAFEEFDFILRWYPNHPRALGLMAETCFLLHRPEAAEKYFEAALNAYPDNPRTARAITLREYGKYLYRAEDNARAIDTLKKSLALDDTTSETHYYLGMAYLSAKDLTRANIQAQRAYAKHFPLQELRDKLMAAGAWDPTVAAKAKP
jgi:tetratricopeptide (TPR) repeat protein